MIKLILIMISTFDIQSLDKFLKDFYTVVGIRISIFDDNFKLVTEYPKDAPQFCKNIRDTKEGLAACHECDKAACQTAKRLRRPHIYTCHAGICEAITPIQIGGGVLGYAILAHMLPAEGYEEAAYTACTLAERYGVNRDESSLAVLSITKRSIEEINSAVHILDAIASYLYMKNLVQWRNDDISANIERFIKSNLGEQLSSNVICKRFNCSRSSLYKLSMNSFGMGIMKFISFCRIERAKEVLLSGATIAQTAESCGFGEYNYFCKVFKKSTGFSPSEFRNKKIKGE